jgi:phage terminase large subunit GpA-like protein
VCKECGSFFDEKHKKSMLSDGAWMPTAEAKTDGFYSYHISGLYAPPGTEPWHKICEKFSKCFDADGRGIARKLQTFNNLILGETFKEKAKNTSILKIASNTRSYQSGTVPSQLSEQDGNGKIILLTCSCDINGTEEDARLDWEILAHSENESTYSIDHGSLGTYDNTKKQNENRQKLTYRLQSEDSVWTRFTEIWQREYTTDDGRQMRVMLTGIDSGYLKKYAYEYCDKHQGKVVPLKGQDDMKARRLDVDTMPFKQGQERDDLYLVQGNQLKDYLADMMQLTWESGADQPAGFMNFPYPAPGKYTIDSYFVEYQGEERRAELNADGSTIAYKWEKKHNSVRNHFWDCRVYNLALRHIFIRRLFDSESLKKHRPGTWQKYVKLIS